MKFGVVTISEELLFLIAFGGLLFLILSVLVIPRVKRRFADAKGAEVTRQAVKLSVLHSIRFILLALFIAPLVIMLVYGIAQFTIENSVGDKERLSAVIATRDMIETAIEPIKSIAFETWVAAIALLGAIWIWARMSGSRRRWNRALEARRKAHAAAIENLSDDDLLRSAEEVDPRSFGKLKLRVESIKRVNLEKIRQTRQAKVLSIPNEEGEGVPASIDDVRLYISQLEAVANSAVPEDSEQVVLQL